MSKEKVNQRYSFNAVENEWRDREKNTIKFKKNEKTKYILEMFPYPSGNIHVGHVRNYVIGEVLKRFYYLNGFSVFRPMGWDAFGLPAENAAIENNTHPRVWTENNITNMKFTLEKIGYWYDWNYELATCHKDYYKHQQKIFIEMYKNGLVSRKKDWVNWDPVGKTVLANEQVDANGRSWRSGAIVEKKQIEQWFLNISKYSNELLKDLDLLKNTWPEKVITMQKNWIGKNTGYIIPFIFNNSTLNVFTTTPEVVYGCTFLLISPQSQEAMNINSEQTQEYLNTPEKDRKSMRIGYCKNTYNNLEIPIYIADYVINGYGTGIVMGVPLYDKRDGEFAKENDINIEVVNENGLMINSGSLNGLSPEEAKEKITETLEKKENGYFIPFTFKNKAFNVFTITPEFIYRCTYLTLSSEGARNLDPEKFLKYMNLEVNERKSAIFGYCTNNYNKLEIPIYIDDNIQNQYNNKSHGITLVDDDGLMMNSGDLNGLTREQGKEKIIENLEKKECFRLKDWCLSRQRYWGCPIPMIYCEKCGIVPDENLPVELPKAENFSSAINPLQTDEEWKKVNCPKCGELSRRESDTMDTFVDSSWYFLRFPCVQNKKKPVDENVKEVDIYLGGIEHAILHLLYARFFTKAMRDMKMISISEPFKQLVTQGMVCHATFKGKDSGKFYFPKEVEEKDGKYYVDSEEVIKGAVTKMSKSEKNIIDPLEIIESFGIDTLKMFVISDSPVEKDFDWNTNALFGCHRFLQAVWRGVGLTDEILNDEKKFMENSEKMEKMQSEVNFHLFEITRFVKSISLNLYIAEIRKLFNLINDTLLKNYNLYSKELIGNIMKDFLKCFWIICPALSSKAYLMLFSEELAEVTEWNSGKDLENLDSKNIIIQINGKTKHIITTNLKTEEELLQYIITKGFFDKYNKYIYVKDRLFNFIIE